MTEWREIPGWPEYEASSEGQIRRRLTVRMHRAGRPKAAQMMPNGYLAMNLYRHGRVRKCGVHNLVCRAFHGEPPTPQHEAAHWNGIKIDNRPSNLRWATKIENAADRDRHGRTAKGDHSGARIHRARMPRGERNGNSKLTTDDVLNIRARSATLPQHQIAAQFGISQRAVSQIINRKTWRHL